jgi:hypothetical protein
MAKRTSDGNPALNRTAESVGAALGRMAARFDAWKKDGAALTAELQGLMASAERVVSGVRPPVGGGGTSKPPRKGTPKAAKASGAIKGMSQKAASRHNAMDGAREHTKPEDQRGNIRSKAPRTWSNRQPGRG